ncbi:MAG: hypothetical protein ACI3V3_06320 [Faecousia sp.]
MTQRELKKMSRSDLLEMLLEQSRENDRLREQLQHAEELLNNRQLMLDEAGSIAEASLRINRVFETAQEAANQYLENIRALSGRQETVCEKMERETQQKCQRLLAETQEKCDAMTKKAEEEANSAWEPLQEKLNQLMDQQAGLRELLGLIPGG